MMKNSEAPFFYSAQPDSFGNARSLRNKMTSAERLLWNELKGKKLKGYRFRRQHPIGNYIADFYCHKAKLVVEVDGSIHKQSEVREKDDQRDFEMKLLRLRVIRFMNQDIENNLKKVLDEISALLA